MSIFLLLSLPIPVFPVPVVCYYILNRPPVSEVPIDLCTHFILINSAHVSENGELEADIDDFEEFGRLRDRRDDLKLLVSITSPNPSFSCLTSSESLMNNFALDLLHEFRENRLDGVDIDWEFPVWSRDAEPSDRAQFGEFLKILNYHLSADGFLVSVAVSGPPTISKKAYDVEPLKKYADMVQVMNYDFHVYNKYSNPFVGFNAPIHPMMAEISVLGKMNSEASMKTWLEMGLPKNITYFGVPTYARAFQLLSRHLHKPYSPAVRDRPELCNLDDICHLINDSNYKKVWNRRALAPYLYGSDGLWISYENRKSVRAKVEFAKSLQVAGIMVFSVGSDDGNGECGDGTWPLLREISKLANS
ncbi:unnamed protein product [Caenorhabditis sp. 36 PRJEB53466]|nr:unnamed protein product [Caenorhabditis sp. 36 PRJEB53466]